MMSRKYTSKPISLPTFVRERPFKHAELDFFNVDHSGASYEGRIFFNNPRADEATALTLENGYAGAFHIFGHGGCFGDIGHCDIPERRAFDTRLPHPLSPTSASVEVTAALQAAVAKREPLTITVVPIILSATDKCDLDDCFHFDGFRLQLRNPHGEEVSLPIEVQVASASPVIAQTAALLRPSQLGPRPHIAAVLRRHVAAKAGKRKKQVAAAKKVGFKRKKGRT